MYSTVLSSNEPINQTNETTITLKYSDSILHESLYGESSHSTTNQWLGLVMYEDTAKPVFLWVLSFVFFFCKYIIAGIKI